MCDKLINLIKSNTAKLSSDELKAIKQAANYSLNQIKDAVRFMDFYKQFENQFTNTKINSISPEATVDATSSKSLFEVFISLYSALYVGKSEITILLCEKRIYLKSYLAQLGLNITFSNVAEIIASPFGTQIIFDTADVPTAFLELLNAGQDKTSPWRIRSCWIQESLKDQFYYDFPLNPDDKCKEFVSSFESDGSIIIKSCKKDLALVVGGSEPEVNSDLVITVNFFRTAKEVIGLLANSPQALMQQCASVWTENLSLACEISSKLSIPNIWINSVGLLDPIVPFTFGIPGNTQMYGSVLALCQSAIQLELPFNINDDPKVVLEAYLDE